VGGGRRTERSRWGDAGGHCAAVKGGRNSEKLEALGPAGGDVEEDIRNMPGRGPDLPVTHRFHEVELDAGRRMARSGRGAARRVGFPPGGAGGAPGRRCGVLGLVPCQHFPAGG